MAGVSAQDYTGKDITDRITVDGAVLAMAGLGVLLKKKFEE